MWAQSVRNGQVGITLLVGLAIVVGLCTLGGCAAYPQARYCKLSEAGCTTKPTVIPFSLQGSFVILMSPVRQAPRGDNKDGDVANGARAGGGLRGLRTLVSAVSELKDDEVLATQADATGGLYFLEPRETFWTQANVSVTYFDGGHRIKSIGTDFQDNRIKVIEAVGGVVVGLVSKAALGQERAIRPERLELPVVFDFRDGGRFKTRDSYTAWSHIEGYTTWWYRYKAGEPGGRVFNTATFFDDRKGVFTREFPVCPCVELTLDVSSGEKGGDGDIASYSVRVPDPSFVETFAFPRKGNISSHAVCGADMSVQATQAGSSVAVLESVAKEVEAIWKAQGKKATTGTTKATP